MVPALWIATVVTLCAVVCILFDDGPYKNDFMLVLLLFFYILLLTLFENLQWYCPHLYAMIFGFHDKMTGIFLFFYSHLMFNALTDCLKFLSKLKREKKIRIKGRIKSTLKVKMECGCTCFYVLYVETNWMLKIEIKCFNLLMIYHLLCGFHQWLEFVFFLFFFLFCCLVG